MAGWGGRYAHKRSRLDGRGPGAHAARRRPVGTAATVDATGQRGAGAAMHRGAGAVPLAIGGEGRAFRGIDLTARNALGPFPGLEIPGRAVLLR